MRRRDEKVLSTPFEPRALVAFDIGNRSRNRSLGIVVVRSTSRSSIAREKIRVSLCRSFRRLSDGVDIFPMPAAVEGVSILFAVKQYYVVKFIALPRLGLARPYNALARSPYARRGEGINDMRNADVMASATLVAVRRPRDDPRLSGYCPANISLLFSKYPWNDVLIRGENSSEIAVVSIIRDKKTAFLCRKIVRKNLQNRRREERLQLL